MMDEGRKQALGANHQELRSGLIVKNILPALRPYLTDIEYLRVENKPGNVARVDELVAILLTKENRHFDEFCRVCEGNGYSHWAKRLRADAGCRKQKADLEGSLNPIFPVTVPHYILSTPFYYSTCSVVGTLIVICHFLLCLS